MLPRRIMASISRQGFGDEAISSSKILVGSKVGTDVNE